MNSLHSESQIKIDPNIIIFDDSSVKSKYTIVAETFGQWLVREREALGLKQSEFATRAQLKKATLSLYEKDAVQQPRIKQLKKIATALGIPLEDVRQAAGQQSSGRSLELGNARFALLKDDVSDDDWDEYERAVTMAVAIAKQRIEDKKNKQ